MGFSLSRPGTSCEQCPSNSESPTANAVFIQGAKSTRQLTRFLPQQSSHSKSFTTRCQSNWNMLSFFSDRSYSVVEEVCCLVYFKALERKCHRGLAAHMPGMWKSPRQVQSLASPAKGSQAKGDVKDSSLKTPQKPLLGSIGGVHRRM